MTPAHSNHVVPGWTPERMLSRLDGDVELAVQLAEIFNDEYSRMLDQLRAAVEAGAADEVRRAAHALKGSVANFVDGGPTATASELETMGRNGQLEGSSILFDRLEQEVIALTVCLRDFQLAKDPALDIPAKPSAS
jgi:HPt (histidine-containing phosphotransfer) domain-containing protein